MYRFNKYNNISKFNKLQSPGISFDTVLKNVGEAFSKNRDKASSEVVGLCQEALIKELVLSA